MLLLLLLLVGLVWETHSSAGGTRGCVAFGARTRRSSIPLLVKPSSRPNTHPPRVVRLHRERVVEAQAQQAQRRGVEAVGLGVVLLGRVQGAAQRRGRLGRAVAAAGAAAGAAAATAAVERARRRRGGAAAVVVWPPFFRLLMIGKEGALRQRRQIFSRSRARKGRPAAALGFAPHPQPAKPPIQQQHTCSC